MLLNSTFRTVFIWTLVGLSLFSLSECKIIHKAKYVRVSRETEVKNLPRTHLADGTRFEKYVEKGEDLPPMPYGEEEADSLNDPRIGHFDKGGIVVPVDDNGKVLKQFEYLLRPITITIDVDEKDENVKLQVDEVHNVGLPMETSERNARVYKPDSNLNQNQVHPKEELLPEEVNGDEYDEAPEDPNEIVPMVPELPRLDYSDSGESDEDLKGEDEVEEREVEERKEEGEVIIPSTLIEQIKSDEEDMGKSVEDNEEKEEEVDKTVEIPKNRLEEQEAEVNAEIAEKVAERIAETVAEEAESVGLSEQDVQDLANELRQEVFDKVMNKAGDFAGLESSDPEDLPVDPNSIVPVPELPLEQDLPSIPIIEGQPLDGVILPDQDLTDEEIAQIEADSRKVPDEVFSKPSEPLVRGGRIGSGVQPDSAGSFNVFLSFFIAGVLAAFF